MAARQQGTGARKRPCFVFGLLLVGCAASTPALAARGRIAPPAQAACASGNLTAYFGRVVGYKRSTKRTWLEIATDYGTVEAVTVPAGTHRFLYQGRPFVAKDWARIEARAGVLLPGVRATAWVCEGGAQPPLIDWNGVVE
jgi:hypothetical protein